MNEFNPEQFEAELRTLQPAKPTQRILNEIVLTLPARSASHEPSIGKQRKSPSWSFLLRWLAPAGALAAVVGGFLLQHRSPSATSAPSGRLASSARPVLRADNVEIDRQWIADFDAIAKLPTGEPVRFRCEQWVDKVRLRDSAKGLVIEQTSPHLEIVPVRFETY